MQRGEEMNKITTSEMELINSYSLRELTPEDVYVFSVKLCDNDIDRDYERFTVESLFELEKLFVGKTGIIDHNPAVNNQKMRILTCKVEYVKDKVTAVGEPYYCLMARVYLLRNDDNQKLINNIEEGLVDEVSIGCSVRRSSCSICHNDIHSPLCNHRKGKKYVSNGREKLCVVELQEPTDAYEFAFVAEPKNEAESRHLVDVPIPHGRLIDADAHIQSLRENQCSERCRKNHDCINCGIDMYIRIVENEPNILDAER